MGRSSSGWLTYGRPYLSFWKRQDSEFKARPGLPQAPVAA